VRGVTYGVRGTRAARTVSIHFQMLWLNESAGGRTVSHFGVCMCNVG